MSGKVDVQIADPGPSVPSKSRFAQWAEAAASELDGAFELSIRIVGRQESGRLNERYRDCHGPTNVLAFPAELPEDLGLPLLGDLVICRQVVEREAAEQGKSTEAHWAHMVVHGTLHLLGYDHRTADDAERMEAREMQILAGLGYPDPYEETDGGRPSARSAIE